MYLAAADELRLLMRIENNFECLRREGRVGGVMSGWGEALLTKYRRDKAEKSDLSPGQSCALRKWMGGNVTGRIAMLEFLQCDQLVTRRRRFFTTGQKKTDTTPGGVGHIATGAFSTQHNYQVLVSDWCGLSADICETEWLFANVFSRPPQALIYETLLLCAKDALERKPEDLTAQQINLALRKLALTNFPASTRTGAPSSQRASEQLESPDEKVDAKVKEFGGNTVQASIGRHKSATASPAPEDRYLRIQIAMELLRLHVSTAVRAEIIERVASTSAGTHNRRKSDKDCDDDNPFDISGLAEAALGGADAETILQREIAAFAPCAPGETKVGTSIPSPGDDKGSSREALFALHVDGNGRCAVLDQSTGMIDSTKVDKLNRFLQRCVRA
jgi:hypothetical protein